MLPWKRLFRPFAAILLAGAVVTVPTASASASAPTAASASSAPSRGWNDFDCKPSAAHPRPVVLVHGTLGNSVDNWLGLAPYLKHRGYCVFSLDYGQVPGVPFFNGLGDIEKSAEQLSAYVDRVLAATGAEETDVVGHSQGGMMPRYYLKFLGGAPKVHALVGLAPSNHGTSRAGLEQLLPYFPGAEEAFAINAPAFEQQAAGSDFMKKLNAGGDTVPGVRYTVISTRYDEVVTPYQSQFLGGPDVRNIVIQDLCPLDLSEHALIGLTDRIAFHEVANSLDPARATPTTCASVLR